MLAASLGSGLSLAALACSLLLHTTVLIVVMERLGDYSCSTPVAICPVLRL